jgi:hypothetical protein
MSLSDPVARILLVSVIAVTAAILLACLPAFSQTGNLIPEKVAPQTGIVFHEYKPYERTAGIAAVQRQRLTVENFLHAASLEEWRWNFNHPECFYTSIGMSRGGGPIALFEYAPRNLDGVTLKDASGHEVTLRDFLRSSYTDGFLVIHKGKIIREEYFNGFTPAQPHQFASIWKSATGILAAILVEQRYLRWEDRVSKYIPEMAGSAYAQVTVRQLGDMAETVAPDRLSAMTFRLQGTFEPCCMRPDRASGSCAGSVVAKPARNSGAPSRIDCRGQQPVYAFLKGSDTILG